MRTAWVLGTFLTRVSSERCYSSHFSYEAIETQSPKITSPTCTTATSRENQMLRFWKSTFFLNASNHLEENISDVGKWFRNVCMVRVE